jgi:predicted AAA+ superfamily ATPase
MKHVFSSLKNAEFISFEDRDILGLFVNNPKQFAQLYVEKNNYLFIDEFQYAKDGGKILKFIYDSHNTKIIISGSSAAELSVQSIKYLVGRIFVLHLHPFSFSEYLQYKNSRLHGLLNRRMSNSVIQMILPLYKEYLIYGGYPAVVISKTEEEKKEVLQNIYNTYLLREIKGILQISDDEKINALIKAVALQICSTTNYNKLSSLTSFSHYDLIKSINILKKTFIILESNAFFTNKRKELVKSPRFYFLDNGFRNVSIHQFNQIETRVDQGELHENFVASELSKKEHSLKYWKTKAGAEVDFIVEQNGKPIPIEVKTKLKQVKYTRSYRNFIQEYHPPKGIIFSEDFRAKSHIQKTTVDFLPAFMATRYASFI